MHCEKSSAWLLLGRPLSPQVPLFIYFFSIWSSIAAGIRELWSLYNYVTY